MEDKLRMDGKKKALILITLLFIANTTLAQQIYKWKDENGKLVYSDTPPKNKKFEELKDRKHIHSYGKADDIKFHQSKPDSRFIKHTKKKKKNVGLCKNYKNSIKAVNAQLRKGYKDPKTGERLRKKRKRLNQLVREKCD